MNALNKVKSFKTKLLLLIGSITAVVLLVASFSLAMVLDNNFKQNLDYSARSSLSILAYNLAPAVSFSDSEGASQLLASFETSPDVVNASVYNLSSNNKLQLLATYSKDKQYFPPQDIKAYETAVFNGRYFQFTLPIRVDNEIIGYLYQYSVFSQLDEFRKQMLGIISTTFVICMLVGVIISLRFQHVLLEPLSRLVYASENIRRQKDYSIRVVQEGNDEFSKLSVSFNYMLDEIQAHNQKQRDVEEEIRQLNLHLEEKVMGRTVQLADANKQLQTTLSHLESSHNKLVEQEKMASLGELVAGIAHEINTPIGIGVTAVSHLNYIIGQLREKFDNKKLTNSFVEEFLNNASDGAQISLLNLSRAADIISNFKLIAVDQSSDQLRKICLNSYLHDVLKSLNPELKKYKHIITIDCADSLEIYIRAGALVQIITNLIMNSIFHGFENIESGNITITAKTIDAEVHICYEDNGCGMPPAALTKLFEPFYTTKRGKGGSGLGSSLVYNLVTQGLNGRISASSELKQGLKFNIDLPINLTGVNNANEHSGAKLN
jgi:signal transduction histidine kinase